MTQRSDNAPLSCTEQNTQARLAAIESHMRQIETLLPHISQFNSRLDQICATLELAIGFLAPGHDAGQASERPAPDEHTDRAEARFRVIAHLSRDGKGARLVPEVSWPDLWSVRLFVAGLLGNVARSGLIILGGRCWCEVWTPDETGELVDSAFLDPDTGAIDWESDVHDRGQTP